MEGVSPRSGLRLDAAICYSENSGCWSSPSTAPPIPRRGRWLLRAAARGASAIPAGC